MKIEKPEKVIGYVMLIIGLIFIIFPALLAYLIFSSGIKIPQLVPLPGETEGFSEGFAIFSNVCLIFFIFISIMWAGSIISNCGIALIRGVKEEKKRKA